MATETKFFQVRDNGTHIPVMATHFLVTMEDRELRRGGFTVGTRYTVLTNLATMATHYDEEFWGPGRTMRVAQRWIHSYFSIMTTGSVVDVEYILKERDTPKEPE